MLNKVFGIDRAVDNAYFVAVQQISLDTAHLTQHIGHVALQQSRSPVSRCPIKEDSDNGEVEVG